MRRNAVSEFTRNIFGLLDRIEYRRIVAAEDMEDIAALRRKAFRAADILPVLGDRLIDDLDFDPQAYVFGIYYDERLVSTVRIHHVTPGHRISTAHHVFPEAIDSILDAGMTIIDPSRLAADPDIAEELPTLPYITLRIATMATDYFRVDRCLAFVNPRHEAFYRRVFRAHQIVPPQEGNSDFQASAVLLAVDVPAVLPRLYMRYPFFRSQPFERRMMFAPVEEFATEPLTILPTARYLAEAA